MVQFHLLPPPTPGQPLGEVIFFFKSSIFNLLNRKLCSSATESKEATETDESKLDPPVHLLQTKGMGTPVMEEHTPGTIMGFS